MDIGQRFNFGAELIERNLKAGRAEAPAIWFGGKVLTYRDVDALTDRFAAALLRSGIEPEQRVVFILPDSPELAAGYLAAMKIGAVSVPCNPLLRPADYAYFLEESRARILITSRACIERVAPALAQKGALRRVLVVGESGERSFERCPPGAGGGRVRRAQLRALDGGDARGQSAGGRDQPRRAGVLALDQRFHRPAEGGRPRPPGLAALL
jgi:acyl-coenzyme A synthetase/AMP-(fatty) acid ligase